LRRQLFAPCPCSVFPGRPIPVTAPFLERTLWYLRQEAFPIRLEPGSGFCGAGRHSVATLARMQAPLGEKLSPLTSRMIALMESVPIHFAFSRHPEISGFPATKITENQANNRPAAVSLRATRAAAGREEAFESPIRPSGPASNRTQSRRFLGRLSTAKSSEDVSDACAYRLKRESYRLRREGL
jgi:hypothetical protein